MSEYPLSLWQSSVDSIANSEDPDKTVPGSMLFAQTSLSNNPESV